MQACIHAGMHMQVIYMSIYYMCILYIYICMYIQTSKATVYYEVRLAAL